MDGRWVDGWMEDGWMEGRRDRWKIDGWMEKGWMDGLCAPFGASAVQFHLSFISLPLLLIHHFASRVVPFTGFISCCCMWLYEDHLRTACHPLTSHILTPNQLHINLTATT